jgi:hypothetical protein
VALIVERGNGSQIKPEANSTLQIGGGANQPQQLAALSNLLEREMLWRFVRSLEQPWKQSPIAVQLRIVPVTPTARDGETVTAYAKNNVLSSSAKTVPLFDKDYFTIELRNDGSSDAFVTLFDLSPSGSVSTVWPSRADEKNLLPADHKWHSIDTEDSCYCFQIGEPFGSEIIKAIALPEQVNLSDLCTAESRTRGVRGLAQMNPIAQLIMLANQGKRAVTPVGISSSMPWSTDFVELQTHPLKEGAGKSTH